MSHETKRNNFQHPLWELIDIPIEIETEFNNNINNFTVIAQCHNISIVYCIRQAVTHITVVDDVTTVLQQP